MRRENNTGSKRTVDTNLDVFQYWNHSNTLVRKKIGSKKPKYRVINISDQCLLLLGYTRKEFEERYQTNYCRLVHPEDRQMFSSLEDQLATTGFFYAKYRVITKDKSVRHYMEYGTLNEDGTHICTLMDVTDETLEYNDATKYKYRMKSLIRGIAAGVLIVGFDNKKFHFIDGSDNFFHIFGYSREQYLQLERSPCGISTVFLGNHNKIINEIVDWLSLGAVRPLTGEYKIVKKDGSHVCVTIQFSVINKIQNGWEMQVLLSDNTTYRKIMYELQHDQRTIIQQSVSADILFEYDVLTDTLQLPDMYADLVGVPASISHYSQRLLHHKGLYPADVPVFIDLIENLRKNIKISNIILRFCHRDKKYYWYHLIGASITDESGRITRIVGKAVNMNRQKEEMLELLERAQRDPFTKLYNKMMTETLTQQYLSYESGISHAVLIIDIDNFKEINDTYGHMCGDTVLYEFSSILRAKFEDRGVVGRIGGDEFFVFLRGEKNLNTIRQMAQDVCHLFQCSESLTDLQHLLSASVGVSLSPQDGVEYKELFQKADKALYFAKRNGKGDMVFYSEIEAQELETSIESIPIATTTQRELLTSGEVEPSLIFEAMEELLLSKGKLSNMSSLLRMLARVLSVGRVYLAEFSKEYQHCTISCEWCAPNTKPFFHTMQEIPLHKLGLEKNSFDDWRLFRCNDVRDAMDAYMLEQADGALCSTQYCLLYDEKGKVRGFIGCSDTTVTHSWNHNESMFLAVVAGLISRFVYFQ